MTTEHEHDYKKFEALIEMFGPDEKLSPELQAYWVDDSVLGPHIKHPLVYGPAAIPGFLNRQLVEKKKALLRAAELRNWSQWLVLHERPWRMPKLDELVLTHRISRGELRELLIETWMDTELPHQFRRIPLRLFNLAGFITDAQAEWEAKVKFVTQVSDVMPVSLTLYRGDSRRPRRTSISWTTDRQKAIWFARRWKGVTKPGLLWTAELHDVTKVLGYFEGRGEHEVVVSPVNLHDIRSEEVR